MPTLTIELPQHQAQKAFNLRRWTELLADPELARFEGRIETDRHGHIIMSPPPAPSHGSFQVEIAYLLRNLMPQGPVLTECPISTADGGKGSRRGLGFPGMHASIGQPRLLSQGTGSLRGSPFAEQHGSGNSREDGALF